MAGLAPDLRREAADLLARIAWRSDVHVDFAAWDERIAAFDAHRRDSLIDEGRVLRRRLALARPSRLQKYRVLRGWG